MGKRIKGNKKRKKQERSLQRLDNVLNDGGGEVGVGGWGWNSRLSVGARKGENFKMVTFSPLPSDIMVRVWGMVVGSRRGSWCVEGTRSPVCWSEFSSGEWTRVWRYASPHKVQAWLASFSILWVGMGVVARYQVLWGPGEGSGCSQSLNSRPQELYRADIRHDWDEGGPSADVTAVPRPTG